MKTTFSLILFLCGSLVFAQNKKEVFEVGLFNSLYLDQQFNSANELKNPRQILKSAIHSLEFYEGASLAIDSLNSTGSKIKLTIFDTQSIDGNISSVFEKGKFDKLDLIISQLSGDAFFQLAIIAQELNIPIVNATYPNSKGIQSHPGLFIANPRINRHLEVIHKKITVNWKNANIIWFRRDNQADMQIESLFKSINNNPELNGFKFKTVILKNEMNEVDLSKYYDNFRSNVYVLGSFDENFGLRCVNSLDKIQNKSALHIIGMPGWENLKPLQSNKFKDFQFYYTSAFYIPQEHQFVKQMDNLFTKLMGDKCPQMVIKGYEITYYFCSILAQNGKIKINHFQPSKANKIMTDFDFAPVYLQSKFTEPDFYENRQINFIRLQNGIALPYF
jgi:hypothetical protein